MLTQRQQEVFDTILRLAADTGRLPTYREISDSMGFSGPNAVVGHLTLLAKKGFVEYSIGDGGYSVPAISEAVKKTAATMQDEFPKRTSAEMPKAFLFRCA